MEQRTIKLLSSQLNDNDLIKAVEEVKVFRKTGILKEGIVRTFANTLYEKKIADTHTAIRIAEDEILLRSAKRFVEMLKPEENKT